MATFLPGDPVWVRANVVERVGRRTLRIRLESDVPDRRIELNTLPGHAVPVLESEARLLAAIRDWAEVAKDLDDFDGDRRGIAACLREKEVALAALVGVELEAGDA